MSIAGAVASLPGLPRRKAAEARQRARAELDEIEALLDVRDVVLPEAGRTDVQRSCWEGFAGPQDDAAEAAALAVWAALGEPAETWLLFWRCALAGGEAMPRGPRAPRWAREEEEREDRFSRIQGTAPRYTFGR